MAVAFDRQDEEYLSWVDGHHHGFVVNAYRNLNPGYLILHRARCGTITGTPARGDTWTNGQFVKVCSETIRDLELWAQRETKRHAEALPDVQTGMIVGSMGNLAIAGNAR